MPKMTQIVRDGTRPPPPRLFYSEACALNTRAQRLVSNRYWTVFPGKKEFRAGGFPFRGWPLALAPLCRRLLGDPEMGPNRRPRGLGCRKAELTVRPAQHSRGSVCLRPAPRLCPGSLGGPGQRSPGKQQKCPDSPASSVHRPCARGCASF